MGRDHRVEVSSPVELESEERLEDGIALCLSGGGYRAMLFHVGALWRLNELGYLPRLKQISSVSGGSITAATLGLRWGASTLTVVAWPTTSARSSSTWSAVSDVVLSGGGVYDNLGLETAWKSYRTILVSSGGSQMQPEGEVAGDWVRHAIRVNSVINNQVRNLRKRQTIAGFTRKDRHGTYWGIRSHFADYGPPPGSWTALWSAPRSSPRSGLGSRAWTACFRSA